VSHVLSPSLQDVRHLKAARRFTLIGTPGTTVAFASAVALDAPATSRIKDPRATALVPSTSPPYDLQLSIGADGQAVSSPTFYEPSSFLCYVLLQGNVTSCYVDAERELEPGSVELSPEFESVEAVGPSADIERRLAELGGTRGDTVASQIYQRYSADRIPLVDDRGWNMATRGVR
jgi:hypothetical protein